MTLITMKNNDFDNYRIFNSDVRFVYQIFLKLFYVKSHSLDIYFIIRLNS